MADQDFFTENVTQRDPELNKAIEDELARQQNQIELIASENIASMAVREAQGSVMTNKYAEGYPGKRYYGGCEYVDVAEELARERAKQLFGCTYANVQPHSGAQANQAAMLATVKPGDTILGMDLSAGGHLTHGARVNLSGKWFNSVTYGVREDDSCLDYDQMEQLAEEHKPAMIIAGASAYPRHIDWKRIRQIADKVEAWFLADMAHYSGLVAADLYPSPVPHAHITTTTTHKTLRGPRGGMILSNDADLGKKLNSAVFPGLQGGPLMHVIAAKAVAYGEALRPDFKSYIKSVLEGAKILSETIQGGGFDIVTGGTDSHIVLVDLRPRGLKGNEAEESLDRAGLSCNKNAVPFDPEKPMVTSGIRLGTPAGTTRGFGSEEWAQVGRLIVRVLDGLADYGAEGNAERESSIKEEVKTLCSRFPIYEK